MELDQENLAAATLTVRETETLTVLENESPTNREIRERLSWFGPNPSAEIIQQ
ncbi:Hypothetical predicted protein, partial [Pelobates cultripes]